VEDAAPAADLVAVIAQAVDGFVIGERPDEGGMERGTVDCEPTRQSHGRLSWNICWGGRPMIDLSVMPRVTLEESRLSRIECQHGPHAETAAIR
jgi:hypothetical protein